jgi:hypothetical protein
LLALLSLVENYIINPDYLVWSILWRENFLIDLSSREIYICYSVLVVLAEGKSIHYYISAIVATSRFLVNLLYVNHLRKIEIN